MNGNEEVHSLRSKGKKDSKDKSDPKLVNSNTAAENMRDQEINAQRSERNAQNVAKQITLPSYVNKSLVGKNAEKNGFIASKTPKLHGIQAMKSIASRFHSKIWNNKVSITSIVSPSN